jgi:hypothetical protein
MMFVTLRGAFAGIGALNFENKGIDRIAGGGSQPAVSHAGVSRFFVAIHPLFKFPSKPPRLGTLRHASTSESAAGRRTVQIVGFVQR